MEITIKANPKEIAALVVALQERRKLIENPDDFAKVIHNQLFRSTKELVEELKKRTGVKTIIAEPHKDIEISVNGPAIVLVIDD